MEERREARGRGVAVEVEEVAVGARALPGEPGHARRGAAHLVHHPLVPCILALAHLARAAPVDEPRVDQLGVPPRQAIDPLSVVEAPAPRPERLRGPRARA